MILDFEIYPHDEWNFKIPYLLKLAQEVLT